MTERDHPNTTRGPAGVADPRADTTPGDDTGAEVRPDDGQSQPRDAGGAGHGVRRDADLRGADRFPRLGTEEDKPLDDRYGD